MGCLVLLLLAFVFRGAIMALLGFALSLLIVLLSLTLSLGFWAVIILILFWAVFSALG